MPAGTNEMSFQVDGFVPVDPAKALADRAQALITSRQWSTPEILYGDQAEPDESREQEKSIWSMTFLLGLDHVPTAKTAWFSDVTALMNFAQEVARETDGVFHAEFRLRSRLWYSCALAEITRETDNLDDELPDVRAMLEAEIARFSARRWWKSISWGFWIVMAFLIIAAAWSWWFGRR